MPARVDSCSGTTGALVTYKSAKLRLIQLETGESPRCSTPSSQFAPSPTSSINFN
jgi:hypothetical protein